MTRRSIVSALVLGLFLLPFITTSRLCAEQTRPSSDEVLRAWYRMALVLTRHTPTYSPPVASRTFGYLGVAAYEAMASARPEMRTFAGQLNGLSALPKDMPGQGYDEALVLDAALETLVITFYANTGPTGQRALDALKGKLSTGLETQQEPSLVSRSKARGEAIARHVLAWAATDGAGDITNLGFPTEYKLGDKPESWKPTNTFGLQQRPLLPHWGKNRPFAMGNASACRLPPPPAYSEDPNSEFYKQAKEVLETAKARTPEQKTIARFWSDDPMLSPTPPGHWIAIALQLSESQKFETPRTVELLARMGIVTADAFIGNWETKFTYDLLRPVTFIRRTMDPTFEPQLITPPFPEYPSGHSTVSGAAADVLTAAFGENFAFTDETHKRDKLKARSFASFRAAADEAARSRLYGGIHFRAGIEMGLEQGRCVAKFALGLKTR
jgi:hypothetical protein